MLLVNARSGPSPLNGTGLIAQEHIPRGTPIWRFRPGLDAAIPKAEYDRLPLPVRTQLFHYGYFHEASQTFVLSADDDRFTNHSDEPTCRVAGDYTVAVCDLAPGDEITATYSDLTWLSPRPLGFECRVYIAPCDLGHGLFAVADIRAGESILRFDGERISLADAIAKGDTMANPLQVGPFEYVDLVAPGVFGNHSCDPNAGVKADRTLVALRDIRFGEEVRYDYSTTMWEEMWTMPCRCGAPNCRGVVEDFPLLPDAVRERYLRLGVVQRFIRERLGARNSAPCA